MKACRARLSAGAVFGSMAICLGIKGGGRRAWIAGAWLSLMNQFLFGELV